MNISSEIEIVDSENKIAITLQDIVTWALNHERREKAWPKWSDLSIALALCEAWDKNRLGIFQAKSGSRGILIAQCDSARKTLLVENILCDDREVFHAMILCWNDALPDFSVAGLRRGKNPVKHSLKDFTKLSPTEGSFVFTLTEGDDCKPKRRNSRRIKL